MSQEEGAERSHEPTQQKLEDARKKGELVKSQDVATAASYLGVLLCLILIAPTVGQALVDLGGTLLANSDRLAERVRTVESGRGGTVLVSFLSNTALLVAPAAALIIAAIVAQQAFVVAPSKLAPKLSRISLLANAKNKFGPSGLFEFAKSAVKMLIYGGFMGWFLVRHADRMVAAATVEPRAIPALIPKILAEFAVGVVLVATAIAAIDYFWQRHTHMKKNMMTRQEVLDETKQSEGDPMMRAKRRQKGEEIALNSMLKDVPDAAVIVVNPTHFAVALKWSPMDPTPPICVAKGVDHSALRIREIAAEAGVPIFSDPPTARALFASVEVGDTIEREHYAAVAAAVRFARELDRAQK